MLVDIGGIASSAAPAAYKAFTNASVTVDGVDESGFNISDIIYVDNDGRVRAREDDRDVFTTTQIDDYWSITPVTGVGAGYHIKLTPVSGSSWYSGGDTLSTWHDLTTSRSWNFTESDTGPTGVVTQSYTLAISDDGGSTTLDTMTIVLSYEWLSP